MEMHNHFHDGGSVTPAIDAAKSAGIDFHIREYQHSPNADSYGLEAVQKLGLHPEQVFKTLVVTDDKSLFVGIIPVESIKFEINGTRARRQKSQDGRETKS